MKRSTTGEGPELLPPVGMPAAASSASTLRMCPLDTGDDDGSEMRGPGSEPGAPRSHQPLLSRREVDLTGTRSIQCSSPRGQGDDAHNATLAPQDPSVWGMPGLGLSGECRAGG